MMMGSSYTYTTFVAKLLENSTRYNCNNNQTTSDTIAPEDWQLKLAEVSKNALGMHSRKHYFRFVFQFQGAALISSLMSFCIGATGLLGFICNFFGPISFVPIIMLTAIYLFTYTAT